MESACSIQAKNVTADMNDLKLSYLNFHLGRGNEEFKPVVDLDRSCPSRYGGRVDLL